MADYTMPSVGVGDLVFWYDNPTNPAEPSMGWVLSRPGRETISILVFSPTTGFVEKQSVRHVSDPFWKESEMAAKWQIWGVWDYHPSTATLKELSAMLVKAKLDAARGQKKEKEVAA